MPYKISGTKSETGRVIVFKESDWSIESNTVVSGSGAYEITDLIGGQKLAIARSAGGEIAGYGNVVAAFYESPLSDFLLSGTPVVFNSASTNDTSSVMLDSTHVMVSYMDTGNSNYGTSIIGTIDGTSISWGSEYVFNSVKTEFISSVMVDSTHVIVSYRDFGNSYYGTSIIGTIDGTSITWGNEYVFNSGGITNYISSVMIDSTHVLVSYTDNGNSNYGTSIIGTISNEDEISWGSASVFNNNGDTDQISSVMLDSTHVVVSYRDGDSSYYGTSIVGTIDGTSITWGSESVFNNTGPTTELSSVMLDSTHVLVSYTDYDGGSYYGTSIVGTINGTSIAFGSEYVFNNTTTAEISSVMLDSTHVLISYRDYGNSSHGTSIVGTIDGTTITWENEIVFNSGVTGYTSSVMLDSTHVMVSYRDDDNSYYGTAVVLY
jgi:hypothetical protein